MGWVLSTRTQRKEVIKLENPIEKQIDELVGVFTDPLIVYPGGWADSLPENIKADITTHRLIQLMKKEEEGLASWPEVCAYMFTVTLCHSVHSEWVNIYMYAMTQYKGDLMPKDIRHDELSDYEMGLLTDFRRWIYDRRLKARKEKQRAERLKDAAGKHKEKDERRVQPQPQMALPLVFEAEYEPVVGQS